MFVGSLVWAVWVAVAGLWIPGASERQLTAVGYIEFDYHCLSEVEEEEELRHHTSCTKSGEFCRSKQEACGPRAGGVSDLRYRQRATAPMRSG